MQDIIDRNTERIESGHRDVEQRLEKRNIAFDAIFRLFEKIGTTFDMDTIIKLFLMTIVGQLGIRRIAFFLRREGSDDLELYHSIGMSRDAVFPRFTSGSEFVKWLGEKNGVIMLDDFFRSRGTGDDDDLSIQEALVNNGFSYACELRERDGLVGLMAFSHRVSGEDFSEFDSELLQMMTKVAAITIRNASLYQSVLRSRDELENFSRAKKEFISHTSHELRTPITILRSSLWSVEAKGDDAFLMEIARDAVLRLEEKVEKILSLNNMDINGSFLDLMDVDISSLVMSACGEIAAELEEREISLDINNPLGKREMSVDPSRIKIVITSIMDNAANSIGRNGNINIVLAESLDGPGSGDGTEISAWESEELALLETGSGDGSVSSWIVLRISDDGIGIPESEISEIGRPFVRASNSAIGDVKGLGLGLSVSQKIVAGHGGRIFCRSAENEGAEFSIWLPVR